MSNESDPVTSGGGRELDENKPADGNKWGILQWIVVGNIVLVAITLCIPSRTADQTRARLMQASSNCRQILITLKSYAGDHNGSYPEGYTANDAFRELFKLELLEDERAFTVTASPFEPDNNIGEAPLFAEALEPGENHWAMTRGVKDTDDGNIPLVFENAINGAWPPYWNADAAGQKKEGRAWKSGKIVIGRNDGSVTAEQLESVRGDAVTLKAERDGRTLFDLAGPHEIMDVGR